MMSNSSNLTRQMTGGEFNFFMMVQSEDDPEAINVPVRAFQCPNNITGIIMWQDDIYED